MGDDAGLAALACPRPQWPPSHRVPRVRSCPVQRRRPRLHGSDFGQPGLNFEYFLTPFPGGAQLGSSSVTLAGALSWLAGYRVELLDAVTTPPVVETHGDGWGSPWSPAVMDSAGRKAAAPASLSVGRTSSRSNCACSLRADALSVGPRGTEIPTSICRQERRGKDPRSMAP